MKPGLLAIMVGVMICRAAVHAQDAVVQGQASNESSTNLFSDPTFSARKVAERWGLTVEEVLRYEQLSEIDKPFTQPGAVMTPYEVLGKFARTAAERDRYARMYADAANDNHARALEWVIALESVMQPRAVREAELTGNSEIIGERVRAMGLRLPGAADLPSTTGSRPAAIDALFFVPTPCEAPCTQQFQRLRSKQALNRIGTIQVVFTDLKDTSDSRDTVYRWAADHDLRREEVGPDKPIHLSFESKAPAFAQIRAGRAAPLVTDLNGQAID